MRTKLEAVNFIMAQVGAPPVPNLSSTMPNAQAAVARLDEASQWYQSKGFWFNTEHMVTLSPTVDGEIPVGNDVMRIETNGDYYLTVRDGKLYDPYFQTSKFAAGGEVDLVIKLPYDNLPPSAQDAVMYRAAATMVEIELEDVRKASGLKADYTEAHVEVQKHDTRMKRKNRLKSPVARRMLAGVRPYRARSVGGRNFT